MVALVGPNDASESTLSSALAGEQTPVERVEIHGLENVTRPPGRFTPEICEPEICETAFPRESAW
ncbi:hypothetical protein GCM10023318_02800 [Nocardia callitridis]|uniref:Uncharacterized protein n=1 Tax=Nocardia callitridis TaxID=648753 RepID=A0ABP9JRV5_9NOCA